MSTPKQIRRPDVLGCNIKKGQSPGGFTTRFGIGFLKNGEFTSMDTVNKAASEVLAKRGVSHGPNAFDRTVVPQTLPSNNGPDNHEPHV